MSHPRPMRLVKAALVAAALYLPVTTLAGSDAFRISNPDWFINLTASGYADIGADVRGGRSDPHYFREYLSGEWGAAVGYQGAPAVEWFEPMFVFPDWTTNSAFMVTSPFSFQDRDGDRVPDFNADGFNVYTSTIANAIVSVTQTYLFGFVSQIDDAFLRSLLRKDEAAITATFLAVGVIVPPEIISGIARSDEYVHNVDVLLSVSTAQTVTPASAAIAGTARAPLLGPGTPGGAVLFRPLRR